MKLTIETCYSTVTVSIDDDHGDDINIDTVIDQLVVPALLATGYSVTTIETRILEE